MNNADKFKQIFDLYATELWAMSEKDFLAWLNAECDVPETNVDDLISRQAALEEIQGFYPPKVTNESEAEAINRVGWECAINCIEAYLRTVKPIDPVKHGKWIEQKVTHEDNRRSTIIADWQSAKCSNCGKYHTTPYLYYFNHYNYCPNCGAKMDGEDKPQEIVSYRNDGTTVRDSIENWR